MKNFLFVFVFLGLPGFMYAQPFGEAVPGYRIVKLDYENSSGEKGSTFFAYNVNGVLVKALWSLDDKSRSSVNHYEHDENGNLVSAFREFSDGLTSFELFMYDSSGNKVSEYFYRSDSLSGFASYEYRDNRLITALMNNYKGWLNGTVHYSYNKENKRGSGIMTTGNNAVCRILYEYDSTGNLSKESWDFNGKWSQTFYYSYEKTGLKKNYYSSPFLSVPGKYRISKEYYTFNNETGGPSSYAYNEQGLLTGKVFTRSDGVSTETYYKYDEAGKPVSSERNYSNGEVAEFFYCYDENDNLVTRYYYRGDTLFGFESYLYDSDGLLCKAYLHNFDNWLTGTISFDIREPGVISGGEFKGRDGFDASIVFTYNTEGLLSEIKWDFSFGKFQQYRFDYELTGLP
ncbi:MAG: hypothetical protein PVF73_05375 [Bacteroidales bacterium]|jgi:hypothetical protein